MTFSSVIYKKFLFIQQDFTLTLQVSKFN